VVANFDNVTPSEKRMSHDHEAYLCMGFLDIQKMYWISEIYLVLNSIAMTIYEN
jgi:hypothetical protein